MWVRVGKTILANLDKCIGISVRVENDKNAYSVDICLEETRKPLKISYSTLENAENVVERLKEALANGKINVFTVPSEEELLKEPEKLSVDTAKPCMSIEEAINLWNGLSDFGIKSVRSVPKEGSDRYKLLKARLIQFTKDEYEACIENIRNSHFLQQATFFNFDWFIKPSNFPKVLDDKYADKTLKANEW